jgi:hypothetical protein
MQYSRQPRDPSRARGPGGEARERARGIRNRHRCRQGRDGATGERAPGPPGIRAAGSSAFRPLAPGCRVSPAPRVSFRILQSQDRPGGRKISRRGRRGSLIRLIH